MKFRTYSELRRLETFDERYEYLALGGEVGVATFGFDRWLNQHFYRSREWKDARDAVVFRDNGCDLGIPDRPISARLMVHHMNPITPDDLQRGADWILDPRFLICVTHRTHNAIHYGDRSLLPTPVVDRQPGDTRLW